MLEWKILGLETFIGYWCFSTRGKRNCNTEYTKQDEEGVCLPGLPSEDEEMLQVFPMAHYHTSITAGHQSILGLSHRHLERDVDSL